jgi:hypothetical protein
MMEEVDDEVDVLNEKIIKERKKSHHHHNDD